MKQQYIQEENTMVTRTAGKIYLPVIYLRIFVYFYHLFLVKIFLVYALNENYPHLVIIQECNLLKNFNFTDILAG